MVASSESRLPHVPKIPTYEAKWYWSIQYSDHGECVNKDRQKQGAEWWAGRGVVDSPNFPSAETRHFVLQPRTPAA